MQISEETAKPSANHRSDLSVLNFTLTSFAYSNRCACVCVCFCVVSLSL